MILRPGIRKTIFLKTGIGQSILIAIVVFLFAASLQAQWAKSFPLSYGVGSGWGGPIITAHDGGYIVSGEIIYYGGEFCGQALVHVREDGHWLWSKEYGGCRIIDLCQGTDDSYILLIYVSHGHSDATYRLLKISLSGDVIWAREVEGGFRRVVRLTGGTYIALDCGGLYQFDDNGHILQVLSIGGLINAICPAADGGFIVTGRFLSSDAQLTKFSSTCEFQWSIRIGGREHDEAGSVVQTEDGGYIFGGTTRSFDGTNNPAAWLVKCDSSGGVVWQKAFDSGASHVLESWNALAAAPDGGCYALGDDSAYWDVDRVENTSPIAKIDAQGNLCWAKHIDHGSSILLAPNGRLIVSGRMKSDFTMIELTSEGRGCDVVSPHVFEVFDTTYPSYPETVTPYSCSAKDVPVTAAVYAKGLFEWTLCERSLYPPKKLQGSVSIIPGKGNASYKVELTWEDADDNVDIGTFKIFEVTTSGEVLIDEIPARSGTNIFVRSGPLTSAARTYAVRAIEKWGREGPPAQITLSIPPPPERRIRAS